MLNYCIKNLEQIKELLSQLTQDQYQQHIEVISSSIGQHVRHTLEFFTCLLTGVDLETAVNYDNRARNVLLEKNKESAVSAIDRICVDLRCCAEDKQIELDVNFSSDTLESLRLQSTLYRELAYNLEHSIHHQALIRVSLFTMRLSHLISSDFGIAPSTVRNTRKLMMGS